MATRDDQLDDLLAITQTGEFEDLGRMRVSAVQWSADRLTLRLEVDDGMDAHSSWRVTFRGVLESLFSVVDECGLNVRRADHVVLKQYTDPREYLHFAKAASDVNGAIGELWRTHVAVAGDWIPFHRFLNREVELARLLAAGHGLFATGPEFLIAAYADILDRHGCETTRQRLPERHSIREAVFANFGESYVAAESMHTARLSK